MLLHDNARNRPVHLGPYALETLPTDPAQAAIELRRPLVRQAPLNDSPNTLGSVAADYLALFMEYRDGETAAATAPVPDDLERRATDIKGLAYFFDADHAGISPLPGGARLVAPSSSICSMLFSLT